MRKVLYYVMLFLFYVCVVWNALRKHDSIMGTDDNAVQAPPQAVEWVAVTQVP